MFPYGHAMGIGPFLAMVSMAMFLVALIAAVVVVVVRTAGATARPGAGPAVAPRAEEILAMRFARGEIDEDEYRGRLDAVRGHSTT